MSALCVMASGCVALDRASGLSAPAFTRALCEDCERVAHSDVSLLRYDYVDLSQLIARQDAPGDAKIARPKPRSTPPINLDVDALRSEIATTLWIWEQPVRWAVGLPPRPPAGATRDGWTVDHAVRVIAPRVQVLAALPEIGAYHDGRDQPMAWVDGLTGLTRLRDLHRRSRHHTGLLARNVALPGECPKCAAHALSRRDGTEAVTCGNCRGSWSYEEYSRYVMLVIAENTTTEA